MRFRVLAVSIMMMIMLSSSASTVNAVMDVDITIDNATILTPLVVGSVPKTDLYTNVYETPNDICITNDGTIFLVAAFPLWRFVHGPSPSSFIAWRSDGSVRWAHRFRSHITTLHGVATDDTHVFILGGQASSLFLAKYDMDGSQLWNVTPHIGDIDYGVEWGSRLYLLGDGTIITSGISMNYSDDTNTHFMAAFDQEGDYLWHLLFQSDPTFCCDSDFIYLVDEHTIVKLDGSGAMVWMQQWEEARLTDDRPAKYLVQSDVFLSARSRDRFQSTSVNISVRNLDTHQELWVCNFRLCDSNLQPFESSGWDFVAQDGSMMFLTGIEAEYHWYLLHINQTSELAWNLYHLDMNGFRYANLEIDEFGNAYVAAVSTTQNISMFVFDSSDLLPFPTSTPTSTTSTTTGPNDFTEVTDSTMIALAFAAVVIIDAVLILVLKERWSGRS